MEKFHPIVCQTIAAADVVLVKGGRNHELLNGVLNKDLYTLFFVAREFTASQAGYEPINAPLMLIHAPPNEPSWWGFRGRAHRTIEVTPGVSMRACWTTIAEMQWRRNTVGPVDITTEIRKVLDIASQLDANDLPHARADIQRLLKRLTGVRDTKDYDLIQRAQMLVNA